MTHNPSAGRTAPPLAPLLLVAIFALIWCLDLRWWRLSPDVLCVTLLLPLAWYLASRHPAGEPSKPRLSSLAALGLVAGIVFQQITLIAFSWAWLAVGFVFPATTLPAGRLWLLAAGAFPWMLVDGQEIGWWFRLSGSAVTARIFEAAGCEVVARGTFLEVNGLPISVEAACGGLRLLQVLLSGGVALSFLRFHRAKGFWWMVALLPALAWFANTLRIVVITAWGLRFGADSAAGAFHTWGAMVVVIAMLGAFVPVSALILKWRNRAS